MNNYAFLKISAVRTTLIIGSIFALGAAAAGCRSAYGVDPEKNPGDAAKTPGIWRAELRTGLGAMGPELYILESDGNCENIKSAVAKQFQTGRFQKSFLFGDGNASGKMAEVLSSINLEVQKSFKDL